MSQIHPDRTQMPQPEGFEKLKIREPEKIVLNNGIPVYLIPGKDLEATRLDIVFDAGTSFQDVKLQAAAVNDMLTEGTRRHSSFEIAALLDFHGAYTDYFLTKDTAGITLYGITKYFDRLLPLMAELITEAVFPQDELNVFLDRRKQEFQVNSQKVNYKASQAFNKLIFGKNSAYGQTLEEQDFDHLKREDLLDFYRKHYIEKGFYIILSGNIDKTLIKNADTVFGQLPQKRENRPVSETRKFVLPCSKNEDFIKKENALQSALRIGGLSIPRSHPDFPGLSLLNTVLGGYFGSRLMRTVREEKGYTYGIYSALQNYRHADMFGIATEVNAKYTSEALQEIKHQMQRLCEEKIPADELQTVKNYVYGSYLRNFDGPMQLADRFKKSTELNLPFSNYQQHLNRMMELTPDDLFPLAEKYLNPAKMKTLVVGSFPKSSHSNPSA